MLESSLLSGSVCEARSLIDAPAQIGGEAARWMDEEKWHGLGKKWCGGFRERSGLTEEKRRIWGEGARGWRGEAADLLFFLGGGEGGSGAGMGRSDGFFLYVQDKHEGVGEEI